jgi:two-component system response regulator RegA
VEPGSLLLVDDDAVFRSRLARAFRERGFEVRDADGFDRAVELAREDSPEYAIVDMRMPGKSGLELVRELVTIDAATRVLVLTGYGSIATAVEVGYVQKPADVDDLVSAFARAALPPLESSPVEYDAPSLARAEWEHINRVLADCGGNVSEAARKLGVHRRSLQRKLQKAAPK